MPAINCLSFPAYTGRCQSTTVSDTSCVSNNCQSIHGDSVRQDVLLGSTWQWHGHCSARCSCRCRCRKHDRTSPSLLVLFPQAGGWTPWKDIEGIFMNFCAFVHDYSYFSLDLVSCNTAVSDSSIIKPILCNFTYAYAGYVRVGISTDGNE